MTQRKPKPRPKATPPQKKRNRKEMEGFLKKLDKKINTPQAKAKKKLTKKLMDQKNRIRARKQRIQKGREV